MLLLMVVVLYVPRFAGRVFARQLNRGGAVPFNVDHRDQAVRQYAPDGGTARQIFELGHILESGRRI
jgi:hypothetical protein